MQLFLYFFYNLSLVGLLLLLCCPSCPALDSVSQATFDCSRHCRDLRWVWACHHRDRSRGAVYFFRENYNSVINLPTPTDIKGSREASCDGSFACLR
jgi:hypothetical protein